MSTMIPENFNPMPVRLITHDDAGAGAGGGHAQHLLGARGEGFDQFPG